MSRAVGAMTSSSSRPPRRIPSRQILGAALLLGPLALACGATAPASPPGSTFTAFATDFDGFHSWPSGPAMPNPNLPPVPGGDGVDAGTIAADGGVHVLPLTVYWNHPPSPGSTAFPVGTIIVKETDEADPTARKVFAMVKRGGDFNPTGAVNWEWFELQNTVGGTVAINWRGYGPTSGSADVYGGNPHICNDCHEIAISNDYAWSSALQLSNF
jgi:hypothetical protein